MIAAILYSIFSLEACILVVAETQPMGQMAWTGMNTSWRVHPRNLVLKRDNHDCGFIFTVADLGWHSVLGFLLE